MTSFDDLHLAELLCARLCHDLSGPVGAASAGAELFEDLGGGALDAETLGLVAASAAGAAARLKFFRAAFGPAAATPQAAPAVRELIEAYLRTAVSAASPGLELSWRIEGSHLSGGKARLLLNLVLLAKDALPRGGLITVTGDDAAIGVMALGQPAALSDEARDVLVDGRGAGGPRGAQALFARLLADTEGLAVKVAFTSDGVSLTAGIEAPRSDGGIPLSGG